MRVSNFSVLIPEGQEYESGHVRLPHNTQFCIKLGNHDHRDCDATVFVDGKEVGCFRLQNGNTLLLERPVHDNARFTFFKADSEEAHDAGVSSVASVDRGTIRVIFRPEKVRRPSRIGGQSVRGIDELTTKHRWGKSQDEQGPQLRALGMARSVETAGLGFVAPTNAEAGITGLTGHSDQNFYTVPNLDYDPTAEVTINLRLVAGKAVRPLTSVPRSNPVPASVE
jgi:hypothetical protein